MDSHYDKLFNLHDDYDVHDNRVIKLIGIAVFRKILDEDLDIINNSNITEQQWANFKKNLINEENLWNMNIFTWNDDTIDIIWDNLINKPSRYFQVHMAFEGHWMGDERLADIWTPIDDYV